MATQAKRPTTSPAEVVRREYELMNAHDLDGLREIRTDDVVEEFVPVGIFRGKQEAVAYLGELFAAFPDFSVSERTLVADDEHVLVEWRASATFSGAPFQGVEPTGKPMELRGVDVFEIRDGKIARTTVYYDGMAVARGMGMLPAQGSAGERAMIGAFNAATRVRAAVQDRLDR